MVNNNLGLASDLVLSDVHENFPQEDLKKIYSEVFYEEKFSEAEVLLLTGAPNEYEENSRRNPLINYLNEFSEERKSLPTVITTPNHQKNLLDDDRINQDDYKFKRIEPESSLEEIKYSESKLDQDKKLCVFTNDYHVPRYEKLLDSALEDSIDYIVFGSRFETEESRYGAKWRSEAIKEVLPQSIKDLGKKYLFK